MTYQLRTLPKGIFRAYDIRGVVDKEIDDNAYYTLGRALANRLQHAKETRTFIGRDGRLSSAQFAAALAKGLCDGGIHVFDVGMVTTPMLYYAAHTQETAQNGFMITGSHNPPDYNGLKMVIRGKTSVWEDNEHLYQIVEKGQFVSGQGQYHQEAIAKRYHDEIVQDIKLERPLKIVVDCGNAVAGPFAPQILQDIGAEVIPLYTEVDGRFPNHHPDPTIDENLAVMRQTILAHNADLGVAFDGDADRLGVMDSKGRIIWPDRLMMLFSKAILEDVPGAVVVFDVKCSSLLPEYIKQHGGLAKMCPTGHSIVKGFMKQEKAMLAGEVSGHLFFKHRWYGFDDGIYSACRLLEILAGSPLSPQAQFDALPDSVNTPELKVYLPEEEKFAFMTRFAEETDFGRAKVLTMDGVRVEFEHGFGLLRASNTTPCLIARFEAKTEEDLDKIKVFFTKAIRRIAPDLALPF